MSNFETVIKLMAETKSPVEILAGQTARFVCEEMAMIYRLLNILGNYARALLRTKLVEVSDIYWCPCVNFWDLSDRVVDREV